MSEHICDWPLHGTWDTYPLKWKCPECGTEWQESIADFAEDEDSVYWEKIDAA